MRAPWSQAGRRDHLAQDVVEARQQNAGIEQDIGKIGRQIAHERGGDPLGVGKALRHRQRRPAWQHNEQQRPGEKRRHDDHAGPALARILMLE